MKVVFMGTPQAAVPSVERLISDSHEVVAVYAQPDRPSGRGNRITFSPVKEFALRNSLPLFQPSKIKTPETLDIFTSHAADVAVVVAYGRILPQAFLDAYPMGAVNVHFSLLPKYRGAAPVNWAIVNGETETGVTTMLMDTGLDTGAILRQQTTPIGVTETSVELMARLSSIGADLLSATLADLQTIEPRPQAHELATFAPLMKREDGLIDWKMPAADISNRVRGFQPFPTAFTFFHGARLAISRAFPSADNVDADAKTGEILAAHGDDLIVKCGGETALRIEELQPEGKRRLQARDFLNGIKLEKGTVLGA